MDYMSDDYENLRIHSTAKAKVLEVGAKIHKELKVKPTLTEAINHMADHYMATANHTIPEHT